MPHHDSGNYAFSLVLHEVRPADNPFARQSRSTSVVGCNPSFDRLTRSDVVCDGGVEGNAKVRFARVIVKEEGLYLLNHIHILSHMSW